MLAFEYYQPFGSCWSGISNLTDHVPPGAPESPPSCFLGNMLVSALLSKENVGDLGRTALLMKWETEGVFQYAREDWKDPVYELIDNTWEKFWV